MPTIVRGWPFSVTVRPTIARSPPNLVTHVRWLRTATGGASGAASAAPKGAAEQRGHAEKRKGIRRHQDDADALRARLAHEVHRLPVGAGDVLEHVALFQVVEELRPAAAHRERAPIRRRRE